MPYLDEDSEIQILRTRESGVELYVGEDIPRVLAELSRREVVTVEVPVNLAEQAMLVVFTGLFKSDRRRLDYPERFKLENRLRAWLQRFGIPEAQARRLREILGGMISALVRGGWIEKNPNRPRTLVPPEKRRPLLLEAIRLGGIRGYDRVIDGVISDTQAECDGVFREAPWR